jgi:hypothetical protein
MDSRHIVKITVSLVFVLLLGVFVWLNLVRTSIGDAEAALSDLRSLNTSLALYYAQYKSFPPTLTVLGPPAHGVNANAAGLIDAEMASGTKRGYKFCYIPIDSNGKGWFDKFTITADPLAEAEGMSHYLVDQDLVIRMEAHSPATMTSRRIN